MGKIHWERKKGNRKYIGIKQNRLKNSNTKLGNNVFTFDILPGESCLNCKTCFKSCYAAGNVRLRPTVLQWQAENYWLAKHFNFQLELLIRKQLSKAVKKAEKKGKQVFVRPQSNGGDYFSQDYVELWESIAKDFPQVIFYCYSKVKGILDLSQLESLPNFVIIDSFINGKLNYGKLAYLLKLVEMEQAFICPCGYTKHGKETKGICFSCQYCFRKIDGETPKPCFVIHR